MAGYGLPIELVIVAEILRRRHLFQHHIFNEVKR